MRSLFAIALSCFLAACAQQQHTQLYPGPPLPESQVLSVVVPNELEVQSINGQHVPAANAMFGTGEKHLHLRPGKYRINAFYKNGFDIDGGISHEVIRGRTAVFTVDGQGGEAWRLDFERPRNLEEARVFENEFNGWAVNSRTGERHASEAGQRNSSLVNRLLGISRTADEQSTVAPLGATAATASAVPADANKVAPLPAGTATETLPHNDATLTTLQQLWHLLSPESREAFMQWVAQ